MRWSSQSTIAVAVLLLLAGCTGPVSTNPGTATDTESSGPSANEFPAASAINQSVFDSHATALANASFTLTVERTRKDRKPAFAEKNFTYMNGTTRYLVEPGASQYLAQANGYFEGNVTYYSNGSTTYQMWREDTGSTVKKVPRYPVFNESSENYLWRGWFDSQDGSWPAVAAINATYEREGVETFRGVPVMRYEATDVDTLPEKYSAVTEFSATLLLDANGVIRHYKVEFGNSPDYRTRRITRTYTVSDVGSTDVEKPDWVPNATAGA